jgi:hypothetical protein
MRSSFAKLTVLAALLASGSAACSSHTEGARVVRQICEAPPTSAGEAVQFQAVVLARAENDLHVDFDSFGADFSSITVQFSDPPQWRDLSAKLCYQDEAVLDGVVLTVGTSFGFRAVPPHCIGRPWFLHTVTDQG